MPRQLIRLSDIITYKNYDIALSKKKYQNISRFHIHVNKKYLNHHEQNLTSDLNMSDDELLTHCDARLFIQEVLRHQVTLVTAAVVALFLTVRLVSAGL